MVRSLVYLASPFSHAKPRVRLWRYHAVCRAAAALIARGIAVYSPIAHSYGMAVYTQRTDWAFWEPLDLEMLRRCDELWVLTLPGWCDSVGVSAERAFADAHQKPIRYLSLQQCIRDET